MTEFQKELIDGIEEIALEKGVDVKECIRQAIELTEKEKKEESLEEKVDKYYKKMFTEKFRNTILCSITKSTII